MIKSFQIVDTSVTKHQWTPHALALHEYIDELMRTSNLLMDIRATPYHRNRKPISRKQLRKIQRRNARTYL